MTAIPQAPIVYLDTQDFSRFGDVLRGKAEASHIALFAALEECARAGRAIFAMSMPMLGELLQYDAGHRATTICKAEAVERLCGRWALAYPARLVATDIAAAAERRGVAVSGPSPPVLSNDREWYPDVSDLFVKLSGRMKVEAIAQAAALPLASRRDRRTARALARRVKPAEAARDAAPEMATYLGLPVQVVTSSIVDFLRGKIDAATASQRLFAEISAPVTFAETYFEKVEVDRSILPGWMGAFGAQFEQVLQTVRDTVAPIVSRPEWRDALEGELASWPYKGRRAILNMADEELGRHGLTPETVAALAEDRDFVDDVAASHVLGRILTGYLRQILGLSAGGARIEHSFGGDLVHALYLPHVDLWRADRRFAALVSSAVPRYADRVVTRPKDLPAAIDAWHAARA